MSDIAYRMINEYYDEKEREHEEKMARLEAKRRARDPWLFCNTNCYECEQNTFVSCEYPLKMEYNRYSNPI